MNSTPRQALTALCGCGRHIVPLEPTEDGGAIAVCPDDPAETLYFTQARLEELDRAATAAAAVKPRKEPKAESQKKYKSLETKAALLKEFFEHEAEILYRLKRTSHAWNTPELTPECRAEIEKLTSMKSCLALYKVWQTAFKQPGMKYGVFSATMKLISCGNYKGKKRRPETLKQLEALDTWYKTCTEEPAFIQYYMALLRKEEAGKISRREIAAMKLLPGIRARDGGGQMKRLDSDGAMD